MSYSNINKYNPFDSIDSTTVQFRAFWALPDLNNEKDVLKRLNEYVSGGLQFYNDLFLTQKRNLQIFQGLQWAQADRYNAQWPEYTSMVGRDAPRVVVNHLYDFVEQFVSRYTRFAPSVGIFPASAEEKSSEDAKIAKDVLDYVWYKNNVDSYTQEFVRQAKIFGEAYYWVTWDTAKGDIHPDWLRAQQEGIRIPVLGADGQPVRSEQGDDLYIDKVQRVGDIKYEITPPWHVIDMPCRNRDDIDWTIKRSVVNIDYLKAKYPDKADEIKIDDSSLDLSWNGLYNYNIGQLKGDVIVYDFYHRSTEMLDKGRHVRFTKTAILENEDNMYPEGDLPYLYIQDIAVPDRNRGMSFFQQLYPLQYQINAISSLIYKAFVLFAHPKIAMQENTVDIRQLAADSTIFSYTNSPPSILTMPPIGGEMFRHLDKIESLLEKLSGVSAFSRGEAPSGIRAAKAFRMLEEQEAKRAASFSTRYNQVALINNAKKTIATMGKFADDADGRLARILGKDNEYRTRAFKTSSLTKAYDVRILNSTSLSQSPSGKVEDILELSNVKVGDDSILTKGQIINYLDLGADEQFKDVSTRAAKCAMSENDDFANGIPVKDPTPDEDLITHYLIHMQDVQSREYKERRDPGRKAKETSHILKTEYWMYKKAYGIMDPMTGMPLSEPNLAFQQKLLIRCPDFPVYFQPPVQAMPQPMGMGMGPPPAQGPAGMDGVSMEPTDLSGPPVGGGELPPPPAAV